jgi:hypothetical protein
MGRHKYLIGALLGVIGALTFVSVASSDPTGQTMQTTYSPKKQGKKTFGGASWLLHHQHIYDSFVTSSGPRQIVYTLPADVKFVAGNIPVCQLSQVEHRFDLQARAACPRSIVGQGSFDVNSGVLNGTLTFFRGDPASDQDVIAHLVFQGGVLVLDLIGDISGRTLTFNNIPNTPGTVLTTIDTTFNKRRTGKSTFYVMARCGKKRKWSTTETTAFYSGESLSARSTQQCERKPAKK